uniref:LysM peptidoglycan-binding domain-containing protein n=1 Tax=Paenibacillus phytorum TaxID=2654977 RepID=UPI0035E42D3F
MADPSFVHFPIPFFLAVSCSRSSSLPHFSFSSLETENRMICYFGQHQVQSGDTLASIGHKYNILHTILEEANSHLKYDVSKELFGNANNCNSEYASAAGQLAISRKLRLLYEIIVPNQPKPNLVLIEQF